VQSVNQILADALEAELGIRPEEEWAFSPTRKWRVDLVFHEQKLAVEVDGRSHYRAAGHRRDSEKTAALAEHGYRTIRYPASSVLTQKRLPRIVAQIKRILYGVCSPEDYDHVLTGD
jgi:very-short-patch-repair endonuclease